jgi:energy-coupling factor transporter transmembrane protein EcfT
MDLKRAFIGFAVLVVVLALVAVFAPTAIPPKTVGNIVGPAVILAALGVAILWVFGFFRPKNPTDEP